MRDARPPRSARSHQPTPNTKTNQLQSATDHRRVYFRWAALLVLAAFALYYLLPRLGELRSVGGLLRTVDPLWLAGGVAAALLTFGAATAAVMGSTRRRLRWRQTLIAQMAATALNRITPKGIGSIALMEQYLEKRGLKRTEAAAAMTLVYSAGVAVHVLLLLATTLAVRPEQFHLLPAKINLSISAIAGVCLLLLAAGLLVVYFFNGTILALRRWAGAVNQGLRYSLTHLLACLQLFGGSAAITLLHVVGLYCALRGVGANVDIGIVSLIYLAGSAVASASPTPGGLGAIEAALAVGLTATGISLELAIAGVLLFRLTSFWLPIVPGFVSLRLAVARKLI